MENFVCFYVCDVMGKKHLFICKNKRARKQISQTREDGKIIQSS